MKLKKITASLLLLCMICTSVAFGPSALAETNSSETYVNEALGLMNALGIIESAGDGSEEETDVTRAQFAVYVASILGITASNSGDVNRYFKDVPLSDRAAYAIAGLYERGIIKGSGELTFSPKDLVKPYDAAVMLIRAVYREDYVESTGGYGSIISQNKLMSGITKDSMTVIDAAKMIKSALMMPTMYFDGKGYSLNKSENLLESVYDIYELTGVINSAEGISIVDNFTTKSDQVVIGNVLYKTEVSDLSLQIGCSVKAYVREDSGDGDTVVYCYADNKNKIVEFSFGDFDSISDDFTITYFTKDGSRTNRAKLAQNAVVLKNGAIVKKGIKEAFDEKQGSVRLISNDSSVYTVAIIMVYESSYVTMVDENNECIYLKNNKKIDYNDDYERVKIYNSNGTQAQISDIKKGKLITVYVSEKNLEIYIEDTIVEGTVKIISEDTVTVENTEYDILPNYLKDFLNDSKIGSNGRFYLNRFNEISYAEFSYGRMEWGYMIWGATDEADDMQFKILTADSDIKLFDAADKISLNGRRISPYEAAESFVSDGKFEPQIIKYELNEDGKLKKIFSANDIYQKGKIIEKASFKERMYYSGTKALSSDIPMTKDTVVFRINNSADGAEKKFVASDWGLFAELSTYYCAAYSDSEKDLYPEAVVIKMEGDDVLRASDHMPFMVARKCETYYDSEEDEVRSKIVLGGKWERATGPMGIVEYMISKDFTLTDEKRAEGYVSYDELDAGDLVYIYQDYNGEVAAIEKIFDFSEQNEFPDEHLVDVYNDKGYQRLTKGYAHDIEKDVLAYGVDYASKCDNYFINSNFKYMIIIVYDSSRRQDKVYQGTYDDIITYMQTGTFGSGLVMWHRQLNPQLLFVYKNGFGKK